MKKVYLRKKKEKKDIDDFNIDDFIVVKRKLPKKVLAAVVDEEKETKEQEVEKQSQYLIEKKDTTKFYHLTNFVNIERVNTGKVERKQLYYSAMKIGGVIEQMKTTIKKSEAISYSFEEALFYKGWFKKHDIETKLCLL